MNLTPAEKEFWQILRDTFWRAVKRPSQEKFDDCEKEAGLLMAKMRECFDVELYAVKEQLETVKKERDQARAACAEMRSIIERHCYSDNGEKLAGMIPANVGKGWHSPEEWEKLQDELDELKGILQETTKFHLRE